MSVKVIQPSSGFSPDLSGQRKRLDKRLDNRSFLDYIRRKKEFFSELFGRMKQSSKTSNPQFEKKGVELSELAIFYAEVKKMTASENSNADLDKNINLILEGLIGHLRSKESDIFETIFKGLKENQESSGSFEIFNKLFEGIYRDKTFTDEERQEINKMINKGFQDGKESFIRDGERAGIEGVFATCEIDTDKQKVRYWLRQMTKQNWENHFVQLNQNLTEFLKSKEVNENDIKDFISLIYYLFSQVSDVSLLNASVTVELNGNDDDENVQFILLWKKKDIEENFDKTIEILDPKTIKITINSKDRNHIFNAQKFEIIIPDEVHGVKIRDVQTSFVFHLNDEGQWEVSDEKVFFTIADIY